jgi:acetyl-CoA acetyltransferase
MSAAVVVDVVRTPTWASRRWPACRRYGVLAVCEAGGMANATVVENLR